MVWEAEHVLFEAWLHVASECEDTDDQQLREEHPDEGSAGAQILDAQTVEELRVQELRVGEQLGDLTRALARTRAILNAAEVDRDEAVEALEVAREQLASARKAADTAQIQVRAARHERDVARAETARLAGERALADAAARAASTDPTSTDTAALGADLVAGLDEAPGPALAATVRAIIGDLGLNSGSGPAADLGCLDGLADDQIVSLVEAGRRLAAWAGAVQVHAAGALGHRWAASPLSGHDEALWITACEIALATGLTRYAAADLVETARHLPVGMPRLWAAFAAGRLDLVSAVQVSEKTQHLAPDALALVETGLLEALERNARPTRPQFLNLLDRLVALAAPEAAEEAAKEWRARRGVRFRALAHGMGQLSLIAGAEDIEAMRAALNILTLAARQAARPGGPDDDPDGEPPTRDRGRLNDPDDPQAPCDPDGRRPAATRADVLVDLVTGAADTPAADTSAADTSAADTTTSDAPAADTTAATTPAADATAATGTPSTGRTRRRSTEIVVLVPLSVLTGASEQPATLAGYGPIPAQLARELAATGHWRCAAVDDREGSPTHGTLLGLGRSTYTPAYSPGPGLRRFIQIRDEVCQFPGCRHPATRSELDHRIPWAATDSEDCASATCDCNLHALCRHHHRLKHSGGIRTRPAPGGGTTWTTPTGRRYPSRPEPLT